ncbi:hypothetical protein BG006_001613 [Podila minutissima]|uniref:Uncharacterized protein n=1 Tax=Podila minutissima TaxID=64525 RepID=A0A9P5VPB7_9FUNG|nr:hypothetical protein BG006_001613 [Podila minutissima]
MSMDLQDSNSSHHSDESMSTENRRDMRQLQRHQSKERTIEQVLEKGKILKVSRRLRTRLEYAILKIRRGWSKYTLQEVESLTQPACSPRLSKRPISSAYNSPRQSHRKRTKKSYPDYEELPYKDPSFDEDESKDKIMQIAQLSSSRQSSPTRQYRSRPSFSQFKDSELFLPAKSLMDIATSSPSFQEANASPLYSHQPPGATSPFGYGSPGPLYRESTPRDSPRGWSTYSSPSTPVSSVMETSTNNEEEPDEGGAPSAAQAARTILMLSSPTRPPPRTLHQNYIVEMNSSPTHSPITEWSGPYSPMVSSPLVHFQTAASTPSPDRRESPQMGHSDISSQVVESVSNPPSSRTQPKIFAGLYGSSNRYEPSSPSPLSASLFPSYESPSRSASPTMKRAARFAAAATLASQQSKLAEKAFMQGGEHNTTSEIVVPGSQPGMDYQQQLQHLQQHQQHQQSQHPQQPTQMYGGPLKEEPDSRAVTPPPRPETFHGMRTPPPSVGTEIDMSHYGGHGGKVLTRRNSGLAGDTDLSALYLRRNMSNAPRPPQ